MKAVSWCQAKKETIFQWSFTLSSLQKLFVHSGESRNPESFDFSPERGKIPGRA
jgi:hypothetical protein